MPTIHQQDGFRLVIYTNDHPPAHVHCKRGRARVVVYLSPEGQRPTIRSVNRHAKFNDVTDALRIVGENQSKLWDAWRQIHAREDTTD